MDVADLLSSIELYKKQLDQVNVALESANDKNKDELQELQLNLIQVLELTLSQLDQIEKNTLTSKEQCVKNNNKLKSKLCKPSKSTIDDELELFKQEIALLENPGAHSLESNNERSDQERLCKELLELEGQEVRAPFVEKWGGHSYHNAVVLSVNTKEDGTVNLNSPKVLVLYSQPTDICMLPCRYFLEDKCTFDDDSCKFSHGEEVSVADLKEYITPNKNNIVEGSKILALHSSDYIWHRGTVKDILPKRIAFSFDCLICKHIFEVKIEQIIPLCGDESSENEDECLEQNNSQPKRNICQKETQVYTISSDLWLKNQISCKLGEWEKHTKGIGSKLMSQMGYVVGTGLGTKGDGRVEPVPAYAYPMGVSLDHCMKLRLNSKNGEDFYSVEKRLLREQKKETEKQKKQENFHKHTLVFDIINSKLGGNPDKSSSSNGTKEAKVIVDVNHKVLKNNSTKELNRKNFQISSRISQTQNEITRLVTGKERQRQRNDLTAIKSLDKQIDEMRKELSSLQDAERNVEKEQKKRRDVKKFAAF